MINNLIRKLTLEEIVSGHMDSGWKCTIFYDNVVVCDMYDNPIVGGDGNVQHRPMVNVLLITDGYYCPIKCTDAMYEIGRLLQLEWNGNKFIGNLDWHMVKEIPDEYLAAHPEVKESNPLSVSLAPGKTLWVCEGFRE